LRKIKVYQAEKEAGLTEQILAAKATLTVQAKVADKHVSSADQAALVSKILQYLNKSQKEEIESVEDLIGKNQPDLALIVSILVSTGWNGNDDIFTPAELWKARTTAQHKPMNDGHDETSILGHIIQSRAVDKVGEEIVLAENETPPNEFDIEVAGVLYKVLPSLEGRIKEIIEKANAGEMFVSMETWFPDFAFGIFDEKTGITKLIARTNETAFLTKHLRSFGGDGEFKGQKLGRVLLDMVFAGQGFVETPANPESIIKVAARAVASDDFVSANMSEILEGGVRDMENAELQKALNEATAKITQLTDEIEVLKTKGSDKTITELSSQVEELTSAVNNAEAKSQAFEAEKAELQKQLEEATTKSTEAEAKLVEIEKDAKAVLRLAKLKELGQVENDETTLTEVRDWSDETFDSVIKYAATKAENAENKPEEKDGTEEAEQEADSDKTSDEDKVAEAAKAALESVEENKNDPDFQTGSEDEGEKEMALAVDTANCLMKHNPDKNE